MLEIMNYVYNNIENLNKCNHSKNKYSGNRSYDNNQRLTWLICVWEWKWSYQNNCVNSSSVDANIDDWTDSVGGQARFFLVTNKIKYNEHVQSTAGRRLSIFQTSSTPANGLETDINLLLSSINRYLSILHYMKQGSLYNVKFSHCHQSDHFVKYY